MNGVGVFVSNRVLAGGGSVARNRCPCGGVAVVTSTPGEIRYLQCRLCRRRLRVMGPDKRPGMPTLKKRALAELKELVNRFMRESYALGKSAGRRRKSRSSKKSRVEG